MDSPHSDSALPPSGESSSHLHGDPPHRPLSVPPAISAGPGQGEAGYLEVGDYGKRVEEPCGQNMQMGFGQKSGGGTESGGFSRQQTIKEEEESDEFICFEAKSSGGTVVKESGASIGVHEGADQQRCANLASSSAVAPSAIPTAADEIVPMEDENGATEKFQMDDLISGAVPLASIGVDGDEDGSGAERVAVKSEMLLLDVLEEGGDELTRRKREEEGQRARRAQRREPVVVDWRTLNATMRTPDSDELSPLEHFLLGSTLLDRLKPFFELAQTEIQSSRRGKFNLPVKECFTGADGVLTVIFPSYPMPGNSASSSTSTMMGSPAGDQPSQQTSALHCMVRLQLLICPKQFRLVAKMDYSGPFCPAECDVRVFERYFASQVLRLHNEMAVFAFVSLCRLCYPPVFAAFAQLMQAQMEPRHPWHAELELVHTVEEPMQQQPGGAQPLTDKQGQQSPQQQKNATGPQKVVKSSVVVPDKCKQFLFIIWLKPNSLVAPPSQQQLDPLLQNGMPREGRMRLPLRYSVESDELSLFRGESPEQSIPDEIEDVMRAQVELIRQQNRGQEAQQQRQCCCIWACIRALMEGQHQQRRLQQPQPPPTGMMDPMQSSAAPIPAYQQQFQGQPPTGILPAGR